MSVTFKALSVLLSYPSDDLKAAVGDIREIIVSEGILSKDAIASIQPLLADMETLDVYELQERFVILFDRSRTLSLNLFEHVHGESRDRGPAMVDLLETYRSGGLKMRVTSWQPWLNVCSAARAITPQFWQPWQSSQVSKPQAKWFRNF